MQQQEICSFVGASRCISVRSGSLCYGEAEQQGHTIRKIHSHLQASRTWSEIKGRKLPRIKGVQICVVRYENLDAFLEGSSSRNMERSLNERKWGCFTQCRGAKRISLWCCFPSWSVEETALPVDGNPRAASDHYKQLPTWLMEEILVMLTYFHLKDA